MLELQKQHTKNIQNKTTRKYNIKPKHNKRTPKIIKHAIIHKMCTKTVRKLNHTQKHTKYKNTQKYKQM